MDAHRQLPALPAHSICLLVNAVAADSRMSQNLASACGKLGLTSTWIVDQSSQAKVLADSMAGFELAAAASARSPQRLRTEITNLQAGLQAISGTEVSVVAGEPHQLRSRAALLADMGISVVVPLAPSTSEAKQPRQLPYGLWQLDPTVTLPRARTRWSLLPARRPCVAQLTSAGPSSLAALTLSQASNSDVNSYLKLLQEVATSSRQDEIKVVTAGQMATALSSQNETKPQRSILRRAA